MLYIGIYNNIEGDIMYYCQLCDFKTENRNNIESHHIVPKELKGSNKKFNRVMLCGKCHSMIYVDGSKSGIHSIKNEDSFIIKGWFSSTSGKVLLIENKGVEDFITRKNS